MQSRALLIACVALASCATSTYAPPIAESDSEATTVYFIRHSAEPTAWNVGVYIDGKEYASVANRSHAKFRVKAGEHTIATKWPVLAAGRDKELEGKVQLKAGETRYFLLGAKYDFPGYTPFRELTYNYSMRLSEVSETQAARLLAELAINR